MKILKCEFFERGEFEMKAGEKYLVIVHGWIMCKGVESGKYRIELSNYRTDLTATFYKPRGIKPIVRHYINELMIHENGVQNNYTEVIEKIA